MKDISLGYLKNSNEELLLKEDSNGSSLMKNYIHIGLPGTGKTVNISNQILQAINNNVGVFIPITKSDKYLEDVLVNLIPKEKIVVIEVNGGKNDIELDLSDRLLPEILLGPNKEDVMFEILSKVLNSCNNNLYDALNLLRDHERISELHEENNKINLDIYLNGEKSDFKLNDDKFDLKSKCMKLEMILVRSLSNPYIMNLFGDNNEKVDVIKELNKGKLILFKIDDSLFSIDEVNVIATLYIQKVFNLRSEYLDDEQIKSLFVFDGIKNSLGNNLQLLFKNNLHLFCFGTVGTIFSCNSIMELGFNLLNELRKFKNNFYFIYKSFPSRELYKILGNNYSKFDTYNDIEKYHCIIVDNEEKTGDRDMVRIFSPDELINNYAIRS